MATPTRGFPGATANTEADGTVVLETDLYRLRIDPARGGTIASLVVKDGNREFVDAANDRRFNEYRGYFVSEKKWASSAENRARVTMTRSEGRCACVPWCPARFWDGVFKPPSPSPRGSGASISAPASPTIRTPGSAIPWDIKPEDRRTERRRSHHDGRWKLQAFFPGAVPEPGHLQERRL